jgi:hypothetical protein
MSSEQPPSPPPTVEGETKPLAPEYEFNAVQNQTFAELAENLRFAGWFVTVVVVVFHAVLFARWLIDGTPMYDRFRLVYVIGPLFLLLCSAQFIATGNAFQKVVDTQGSDITHLMSGLRSLNDAFAWLTIIPRVWILVLVIAAVIGGAIGLIHWLGY